MSIDALSSRTFIVIHGSGTPPSVDMTIEDMKTNHLRRHYFDVGYHYFIQRSGLLEYGRENNLCGNHAGKYNAHSIGVCMAELYVMN